MTEPTIDDQIEDMKFRCQECDWSKANHAILASLERLKRLDSQPVPVEPEIPTVYYVRIPTGEYAAVVTTVSLSKWRAYIDTLRSELRRVTDDRDALHKKWEETFGPVSFGEVLARIEAAESRNKRMVELLREPSKLLVKKVSLAIACEPFSGTTHQELREYDTRIAKEVIKAMSAELLKEVE